MDQKLRESLIQTCSKNMKNLDPSHDFEHALRVLTTAERIAEEENADRDIIVPAALFHDIIDYAKNDPRSKNAAHESAEKAEKILKAIENYPSEKIASVKNAVIRHSYSGANKPVTLEDKIIYDADKLDATGAISIMRTFSSTGYMNRAFYEPNDPFCKKREPEDMRYAVDLFFTRLLKVNEKMHTPASKRIAERRRQFLYQFLEELRTELEGR